jgi:DNA-binding transcriptional LysR family regulator
LPVRGPASAAAVDRQELDLALVRRPAGERGGLAIWPETLKWVTSARHPVDATIHPIPLAAFPQGCLYRDRAVHALEAAGRSWRVAYNSSSLSGVQAAISAGLGISILPDMAILSDHKPLSESDGFPPIESTELALVASFGISPGARSLAEILIAYCNARYVECGKEPVLARNARTDEIFFHA